MSPRREGPSPRLSDWIAPTPDLGEAQSLLATSFDMDPQFVEVDFLPALLGMAARDEGGARSRAELEVALANLEHAVLLTEASRFNGRPKSLRVTVRPARTGSGGVLHAKVTLLVYPEAVRLIVGSANLTPSGYRLNREVALPLTATAKSPEPARLIRQALDAMPQLLQRWWADDANQVIDHARRVLDDMKAPRARKTEDEGFLWGGGETPLWEQFLALWPKREPVESMTIVSPFWSESVECGAIGRFTEELRARKILAKQAKLVLVAAPSPSVNQTYVPQLHASYGAFDFAALGWNAWATAASPRVDREDIGADVLRDRPLHAKCVLLEGPETALAYAGSANFTSRGWGFVGRGSNIEAGVALRRTGRDRAALQALIPKLDKPPQRLDGTGTIMLEPPAPIEPAMPWPEFLLSAELTRTNQPDKLSLSIDVNAAPESFSIALSSSAPPIAMPRGASRFEHPLSDDDVDLVWREQVIVVRWSAAGPDGVLYPINAAQSLRERLPLGDPRLMPSEQDLIAYYQGRIDAADVGAGEEAEREAAEVATPEHAVDTSKIVSYQIRNFVEALRGIEDEMARSVVNAARMRLSLLGPISPIALAKQIRKAVESGERSHTAGGFQIVELIALLGRCTRLEVDERLQSTWKECMKEAEDTLRKHLTDLRAGGGAATSARSPFAAYEKVALGASGGLS